MNAGHTPAPWHRGAPQNTKLFGYDTCVIAISSDDALIAAVPAQSNARLIAAAPELLAACQRAVELLKIHGANVDENEPILAAIAKAVQS